MECSLPGSSVRGILQARILEWVACPPSGDLPDLGIKLKSLAFPALAGRFFTTNATWEGPLSPYTYYITIISINLYITIKVGTYGNKYASLNQCTGCVGRVVFFLFFF